MDAIFGYFPIATTYRETLVERADGIPSNKRRFDSNGKNYLLETQSRTRNDFTDKNLSGLIELSCYYSFLHYFFGEHIISS